VGRLIMNMLVNNRIQERETLACMSALHSIYRVVYVPRMERSLLAEAAKLEMERLIPVSLDRVYTAWQDVRVSDSEFALCMVAVPRDNLDSVIETIGLAGLKVKHLELRPLAAARALGDDRAIVINASENGYDITIVSDGIPEITRSLSFPDAAADEQVKLTVIKEETQRTVHFYNSGHTQRPLNGQVGCFISGSLRESLAEVLGYPVIPLPGYLKYPPGTDEYEYVANTGLALKDSGIKRGRKAAVNILPGPAERVTAVRLVKPAPVIAIVAALLIIIALWVAGQMAAGETSKIKSMVAEKTGLLAAMQKQAGTESEKAQKELGEYGQALDALKKPLDFIAGQNANTTSYLGRITAALPGTMFLTSIENSVSTINVSGLSPTQEMVMAYAADLRKSDMFQLVLVTSVNIRDYNDVEFKLTIMPKR
jgi:Tfp pilus assembly protein PilN